MSKNGDGETVEAFEIIRHECSPGLSSININNRSKTHGEEYKEPPDNTGSSCFVNNEELKENVTPEEIEKLIKEKEIQLYKEFEKRLEKEVAVLKERCDFILQNEQLRASYMLREAHRERQEKITALQTQLECKNLAGLMYVMCCERRKSKLEKLRIIEEYTAYIRALQEILTEAQSLILYLSRGYKTAARVDLEWRDKMIKVLTEFKSFIHDFVKGTPETEQFFFNIPELLSIKASIEENPSEDPCEEEQKLNVEEYEEQGEKPWYEQLSEECRPFVMFGDMAEFKPAEKRVILKTAKAAKTAPPKWKQYVFNEMFLKSKCNNADVIKDEYPKRLPIAKWECHAQTDDSEFPPIRRNTTTSIDARGNMGSILKIITSMNGPPQSKATILGARDSMEIASSTKLREKHRASERSRVVINVGDSRASYDDSEEYGENREAPPPVLRRKSSKTEEDVEHSMSALGSVHTDSMQVIPSHVPDQDHQINYEKVCPMEECQRMQVDSFIRTLPPYMRASPFMHFEQTFDEYETCTPEQLQILKKRIEEKRHKYPNEVTIQDPLSEWTDSLGVGVQTSDMSISLAPCTCNGPSPTPVSSTGAVFASGNNKWSLLVHGSWSTGLLNRRLVQVGTTAVPDILPPSSNVQTLLCSGLTALKLPKLLSYETKHLMSQVEDLIPVKQALDTIDKECFFDNRIEFNRFKVIGEESNENMKPERLKNDRFREINKVLKQHPSLLDIFQGNTA